MMGFLHVISKLNRTYHGCTNKNLNYERISLLLEDGKVKSTLENILFFSDHYSVLDAILLYLVNDH